MNKSFLKNFAKFTWKHLCQSPFFPATLKNRLNIYWLSMKIITWKKVISYLNKWSNFNSSLIYILVKVFKNGPSKICGRQPLKDLKWYDLHIKFFKDWLLQILLGPFLNTLTYLSFKNFHKSHHIISKNKKLIFKIKISAVFTYLF